MKAAMVRHDEILEKTVRGSSRSCVRAHGRRDGDRIRNGRRRRFRGGEVQRHWRRELGTARPLRARIGLHTDEAVIVDDTGYASLPINRCSRLMTAAHGGQIVVSGATEMLLRDQLTDGIGTRRSRGAPSARPWSSHPNLRADPTTVIAKSSRRCGRLDAFPGNLPAQVSSFIGRQNEVSRVVTALERIERGDGHRCGRSRQDPVGITGRRRRATSLSRWSVAGRAGSSARSGRRRSGRGGSIPCYQRRAASRSRTLCSRCSPKNSCCS